SNGDVLTQEEYYPYGGTAISAGKSACEVKYKMVRYSGKERDASGLYYYGYRYYQPWLGRWLNPDPAEAVDGLNLFRMVRNNPIRLIDMLGMDAVDPTLAAYMAARSVMHRTIDGESVVSGLNKSNSSVIQAREYLFHGRGNVTSDLKESQEPFWRTIFGRNYTRKINGGLVSSTAVAIKMGAGNCGEHANVTMAVHAGKIVENETVMIVDGADDFDHSWSETELSSGDRVIMDAWAEGPAVMAEDSNFSQDERNRNVFKSMNMHQGRMHNSKTMSRVADLTISGHIDREWKMYKKHAQRKDLKIDADHVWSPTDVLHQDFKDGVRKFQEKGLVKRRLRKEGVRSKGGVSRRIQLSREVAAVGAARALGANVKEAVNVSSAVLFEMDRLVPQARASGNEGFFRRLFRR
ncbi:RHS repeat-associated core domain-containing protein, partial [Chromobacterium violaceum]|uniref:RHS repeat-associated core domain-containing protein n=1 Tax=Chromobacterium violaceum TaxID=536 RepID=UPI001B3298A4